MARRHQLFGAIFIETVAAAPPAPSTLSLAHFDSAGATVIRSAQVPGGDYSNDASELDFYQRQIPGFQYLNETQAVTTTVDEIPTVTWTFAGGTELDTAQKKFGSASALFPAAAGGAATAVNTSFTSPHAGNWTFELFFRAAANSILQARLRDASANIGIAINVDMQAVPGNISANYVDSGGSSFLTQLSVGVVTLADTWYHTAVVREGTSYSLYFDGNRLDTDVDATNIRSVTEGNMNEANGADLWVDEYRVSSGARYTGATYTIPAAPFVVD